MTGRRPLGAHVSGPAALYVLRRIESDVPGSVAHFRATGQPDVASALAALYGDIREAARQYVASLDGDTATAGGNAVTPNPPSPAGFKSVVDCQQAAAALGVSERRVRQLLAGGLLAGRKVGGRWLADAEDVTRLARDRRLTA